MNERADVLERLQGLADSPAGHGLPSGPELRQRAHRRRQRRRAAGAIAAAVIIAAAVVVPLRAHGHGPATATSGPSAAGTAGGAAGPAAYQVISRSGSAVELASSVPAAAPAGPAAERSVATAEEQFALEFLQRVAGQAAGANAVVSPSSLAEALAMLELGARGSSATQLATALRTSGLTAAGQAAAWHALIADEEHTAAAQGISLESANAIWTQRGMKLYRPFMAALRGNFGAGVWQADFAGHPDAAVQALNAWTSAQTHGRIKQLFSPGAVGPQTQLVLANALYLKAAWATPFDPAETADGPFRLGSGKTTTVPFMHSTDPLSVRASASGGVDAVQLPYGKGRFAAVVLMPTGQDLGSYLAGLTPAGLTRQLAGMQPGEVQLAMPKFTLRGSNQLNGTLQAMGVRGVFGSPGLTAIAPGGLSVQDVEQHTYLSVTEQGTEAAAATGIAIGESLTLPTLKLTINRPFLFLVRDTATGAILFASTVVNPGQ
jgi:serpin B